MEDIPFPGPFGLNVAMAAIKDDTRQPADACLHYEHS